MLRQESVSVSEQASTFCCISSHSPVHAKLQTPSLQ